MDVHTFSKGINPKVNIITRREFELACYYVVDQHVSHYTKEISLGASTIKKECNRHVNK